MNSSALQKLKRLVIPISSSFVGNEIFEVLYIVKIPPQTRGDFKFQITPPADMKLCNLQIMYIGDNFPCTEPPPNPTTGTKDLIKNHFTALKD